MSKILYISATQAKSGKSLIALGVMEILVRNLGKVGFFKPIIHKHAGKVDKDIKLITEYFDLNTTPEECYALDADEAANLIALGNHEEVVNRVLKHYAAMQNDYDFILCLGSDFEGITSSVEFDVNAEIAKNLNAPTLLVSSAKNKDCETVYTDVNLSVESYKERGAEVIGILLNHCDLNGHDQCITELHAKLGDLLEFIFALPMAPELSRPNMSEVAENLGAKVLFGGDQLGRQVEHYDVAAMQLRNFLPRLQENSLVISPGDRLDIILGCLASCRSNSMPHPTGILLTGGLEPDPVLSQLVEGIGHMIPILSVPMATYEAARAIDQIHTEIKPDNPQKIAQALGLFERHVDIHSLKKRIIAFTSQTTTPKMFEFGLIKRASADRQHIVLPEGEDERILKAAEILHQRKVATFTLLGDPEKVAAKIQKLGLQLKDVKIVQPEQSEYFQEYAEALVEIRKKKGVTLEQAKDSLSDVSYFGTMMVHFGHADGMVSGAVHSTGHTIRPSLQVIKTKPHCSIVSSVFLMCLADRVLVYGDCAVNPNPDPQQLAEIAVSSAETARAFGIEPRVAMLSYSTGTSGQGADVDKVREATEIAKKLAPDLLIEGPIQYDAAVDANVGKSKMPGSQVAGRATVFIFPDLNTGNNTYKAVQRSASAVAIGPVLQGLNKPVNDLSRGCLVADIVNTIAITAIQAQMGKS